MKIPKDLIRAFRDEEVFLLTTHIGPDGDAIGSCLALAEALKSLGKTVFVYDRDPVPECYRFMPGYRTFRSSLGRIMTKDPLVVLLDCNSPDRAALTDYSFRKTAVIDHHETESDFGAVRWVERSAAATGLMVFHLVKALDVPITKSMATNLYTAVMVDTGSFRYSNTDPDVLNAAAELVKAGAGPGTISEQLYEHWREKRFELLVHALGTLDIRDGVAFIHVTRDMHERTGTTEADTENFANFPRIIDSVKIAVLIREVDRGRWKVSMRSKGRVNVANIAAANGGGGHRNAAGFRITADLATVKTMIRRASRTALSGK
ncbi:MAG TPA: bifunctional oligoribonuclease/PAP phosphatase NrnA [Thermodesulfovibrionales bacterium]|nr:bifunctional oligoribonuclease/PAP phosphatase NrnA [Thermodesulfovibrionales bacterium]